MNQTGPSCSPQPGRGCMPFGSPTDEPALFALQSYSGPNSPGSDGCAPTQNGTCYSGAGTDLPTPGPNAQYYATGDGSLCCCVTSGASIQMWDGTTKSAGQIQIGDQVWGEVSGAAQALTVQTVQVFNLPAITLTTSLGSLTCSLSHILFDGTDTPVEASSLNVGDSIIMADFVAVQARTTLQSTAQTPSPPIQFEEELTALSQPVNQLVYLWTFDRTDAVYYANDTKTKPKASV